jgi:hypothetical protein
MMGARSILITACVIFAAAAASRADWSLGGEVGPVFSGYNDVRVPNDGGTDISLSRDFGIPPSFFYRFDAWYRFNEKHAVGVLAAPLRLAGEATLSFPVFFDGVEFRAGVPIEAKYRFDSYRASYRYNFVRRETFTFGLGFTAKIRDAAISLNSEEAEAEEANTGFVPLLNFGLSWAFADRWALLAEGDALAGPQGRAEDVLVALHYAPQKHLSFKVGYRVLEGGADVPDVYNFALLHYIVFGPSLRF